MNKQKYSPIQVNHPNQLSKKHELVIYCGLIITLHELSHDSGPIGEFVRGISIIKEVNRICSKIVSQPEMPWPTISQQSEIIKNCNNKENTEVIKPILPFANTNDSFQIRGKLIKSVIDFNENIQSIAGELDIAFSLLGEYCDNINNKVIEKIMKPIKTPQLFCGHSAKTYALRDPSLWKSNEFNENHFSDSSTIIVIEELPFPNTRELLLKGYEIYLFPSYSAFLSLNELFSIDLARNRNIYTNVKESNHIENSIIVDIEENRTDMLTNDSLKSEGDFEIFTESINSMAVKLPRNSLKISKNIIYPYLHDTNNLFRSGSKYMSSEVETWEFHDQSVNLKKNELKNILFSNKKLQFFTFTNFGRLDDKGFGVVSTIANLSKPGDEWKHMSEVSDRYSTEVLLGVEDTLIFAEEYFSMKITQGDRYLDGRDHSAFRYKLVPLNVSAVRI